MTDLANPTIESEVASDDPHAACGPACCASIINDAGVHTVTVTDVNDWMVHNLGPTTGGVPQEWNQAALLNWGVPSAIRYTAMATLQATATIARHETVLWHQCDPCADPVPAGSTTESHYRVGYGDVVTMNPGYAFCGRPPLSNQNCTIGDMGKHLEIMMVLPKDGGEMTPEQEALLKTCGDWIGWANQNLVPQVNSVSNVVGNWAGYALKDARTGLQAQIDALPASSGGVTAAEVQAIVKAEVDKIVTAIQGAR